MNTAYTWYPGGELQTVTITGLRIKPSDLAAFLRLAQ